MQIRTASTSVRATADRQSSDASQSICDAICLGVLPMEAGDHHELIVLALLDHRRTPTALEPRTDDSNSNVHALPMPTRRGWSSVIKPPPPADVKIRGIPAPGALAHRAYWRCRSPRSPTSAPGPCAKSSDLYSGQGVISTRASAPSTAAVHILDESEIRLGGDLGTVGLRVVGADLHPLAHHVGDDLQRGRSPQRAGVRLVGQAQDGGPDARQVAERLPELAQDQSILLADLRPRRRPAAGSPGPIGRPATGASACRGPACRPRSPGRGRAWPWGRPAARGGGPPRSAGRRRRPRRRGCPARWRSKSRSPGTRSGRAWSSRPSGGPPSPMPRPAAPAAARGGPASRGRRRR